MGNSVMDNIEINIQLHTIYGSCAMLESSTQYRYNILERLNEQYQMFEKLINNQKERENGHYDVTLEQLSYYGNELKRYLDQYENDYGYAIKVTKSRVEDISESYKEFMNEENISHERFVKMIEEINNFDYDIVLGKPFIDYKALLNQFEEGILKIHDEQLTGSLTKLLDSMSNQFEVIHNQNDVIASTIELIKTINLEVN